MYGLGNLISLPHGGVLNADSIADAVAKSPGGQIHAQAQQDMITTILLGGAALLAGMYLMRGGRGSRKVW